MSDEEDGKIIKDENEEKIEVKPDTYKKFMKYSGGKFPMIMLNVGLISSLLAETYLTMYIGRWALDQSIQLHGYNKFAVMILSLSVVTSLCQFLGNKMVGYIIYKATTRFHLEMIKSVLGAPINLFFDVTPTGLIINRFSKDLDNVNHAVWGMKHALGCFYRIASVIIVIAMAKWYLLIIVPFMFGYLLYIFQFTVGSYREMHRLMSVMKSPILTHLGESISGNSTIRAFNKTQQFHQRNYDDVNKLILCQ